MILTLPVPPSINDAYRNVSQKERIAAISRGKKPPRGRRKSYEYFAWERQADKYYQAQKRAITPMTGPLEITIRLPMKMRGDATNRIKCAEDYLVSRGITGDDKHNHKVTVERADVAECEIEIKGREA